MCRCVSIIPGITMPSRRVDLVGALGGLEVLADLGDLLPHDQHVGVVQDSWASFMVSTVPPRSTTGLPFSIIGVLSSLTG